MITPGYGLTSTERVLPNMMLDFTTASLDSRVTVTRALNTATRVNSSGYIEGVNANLPRFDFSPTSVGTCRGLLIEESRINICTYTEDFNSWTANIGSTVTSDATLSPANTLTADKLVETAATSDHTRGFTTAVTASARYTWSVFAKQGERIWIVLFEDSGSGGAWFNLSTGAVGTIYGTGATATIEAAANGFYRCQLTVTQSGATGRYRIGLASANAVNVYAGNGTNGAFLYGAQLEAGAFATSYIPNLATGTTTRNADVVDMTGTNFSDWYNAAEGTIYAEYTPFTVDGSQRGVFSINDGSANNSADWRPNGGDFVVNSGGANQADMYPGGVAVNTIGKGVLALKLNSMACAKNGGAVSTTNTALMPVAPNKLNIGRLNNNAALSICGWMRKISYWPQRLTDAEVRAFSK